MMDQLVPPPPGAEHVPPFDAGWVGEQQANGETRREAFLAYVERPTVNWSEELEDLHEESSREHFLDL